MEPSAQAMRLPREKKKKQIMNFKASDSEVTGKADSRLKLVRSILVWGEKLLGGSSMVQRTSTLISSLSYSEKFSPMRS